MDPVSALLGRPGPGRPRRFALHVPRRIHRHRRTDPPHSRAGFCRPDCRALDRADLRSNRSLVEPQTDWHRRRSALEPRSHSSRRRHRCAEHSRVEPRVSRHPRCGFPGESAEPCPPGVRPRICLFWWDRAPGSDRPHRESQPAVHPGSQSARAPGRCASALARVASGLAAGHLTDRARGELPLFRHGRHRDRFLSPRPRPTSGHINTARRFPGRTGDRRHGRPCLHRGAYPGRPSGTGDRSTLEATDMKRGWVTVLPGLWIGLVVLVSLAAPVLVHVSPLQPVADPLSPPSVSAPLGTDSLGRDLWARLLYGGRVSLGVSFLAVSLTILLGGAAGMVAAMAGGWPDRVILWLANSALAIPGLLLAMLLVAAVGPGVPAVVMAVGLGGAPGFARLARSVFLQVKQDGYIAAAEARGGDPE